MSFLGCADDAEELFFNDNKKRLKKESLEHLDPSQIKGWVLHPAQRNPVHDVLAAVVVDLGKAYADPELEPVDKRLLLKPKTDDTVRRLADEIAQNLGVGMVGSYTFDVHKSKTRRAAVRAYLAQPPALVVGVDVAKLQPTREQRFLIARELLALGAGHVLLRGIDARGLGALITAIGRSIDKTFPLLASTDDLDSQIKKMSSALSRKTKALLAEPLHAIATATRPVDLKAFIEAAPLSEARAGLLISGAFDAAVRLIAKDAGRPLASDAAKLAGTLESEPRLADLVGFAVSDDHFQARQTLRLAIDS